ncbi:MAG TPA: hypothetical protein VF212_09805 [Longimicrobiales bacterium]
MPGTRVPSLTRFAAALTTLALAASACGPKHRLHEYDFRGRTLALATIAPPHPEIDASSDLSVDRDNPLESLLRVGSEIVRESEAEKLQARLDSAAAAVDVGARMAERVHQNAARHLRATPVDDGQTADFELEVRIERYGIVAASWTSGAYFNVEGDVLLLDGKSGRIIWDTHVRAWDPVRATAVGADERAIDNVVTAIALARMSADQIERTFESLADYAADAVLRQFIEDLDDARRR